jgi:phage terminase Nu1 subunit (DNA packaging protein)
VNIPLTDSQSILPGIESVERLVAQAMDSGVPTRLLSQIYDWDVRTVQLWGKDGIIKPNTAGYYRLGDVISKVDHWRVDIINRKQGESGSKKQLLEVTRLEEQVRQLQMENEKLSGKLRDKEKVERVAYSRARLEAQMLDSLPSRLKSLLASETDEHRVGEILKKEIDHIRNKTIENARSQW